MALFEKGVRSSVCLKHTKECLQPILSHSLGHPTKHHHIERCRARAVTERSVVEEELRVARLALDKHMPRTRPRGDPEVEDILRAVGRLLLLLHQTPLCVPRRRIKRYRTAEVIILTGQAAVELDWPVVCVDRVHVESCVFRVQEDVGRVADRSVEDLGGESWVRRRQVEAESAANGFD